jgi:circadian clock protein KaiC
MRGRGYSGGWHDFHLASGGIRVFPRLVSHEGPQRAAGAPLTSGVTALDAMLGGGVDRGTTTMLIGPSGTGKSTIAAQYALSAAASGEPAALFLFDERSATLLQRLDSLGLPLRQHVENGLVTIQQVNPSELSPSEFVAAVQAVVAPPSGRGASVVVIDSLNGYLLAMPEERFLSLHLRELLTYLGQLGVATFTTLTERGLLSLNPETVVDASYLADTVIAFRYFEAEGQVQQAIAVVKRRTGNHERTLRRLSFGNNGIHVGEALREYRGLLTGVPVRVDDLARTLGAPDAGS